MEWLIIHPKDESTDFLTNCYSSIEDKIIIRDPSYPKGKLRELIKEANNIMLLGHGSQYGLYSTTSKKSISRFNRLIISSEYVSLLREKSKIIGIFCNARDFFNHYDLKGFALGMFVSELIEADYLSLPLDECMINDGNMLLTEVIRKNYYKDAETIYNEFTREFSLLTDNPIAEYNSSEIRWF